MECMVLYHCQVGVVGDTATLKAAFEENDARPRQVSVQPRFVRFGPLCNRRGTLGVCEDRAAGNHDHILQSMKLTGVRARVGKIIEEPQQGDCILSSHHQHREFSRVRACHMKRFSQKNPYLASPMCALVLLLAPHVHVSVVSKATRSIRAYSDSE